MATDTFVPSGLRVLAVEQDRVCRKVLERQLQCCDYNATMVTNAQTALDVLRERKDGDQFDLVISNVAVPNMDGFRLLEVIGLEMDLPVIMLSANCEVQTIVEGIKHGACDYMAKPVRLEQLRGIWTHVVKKTDAPARKLPSEDGDKVEKVGANHTKKYSRKNKKVVDVAEEDESTSTQKKQRVQWSGQLHQKFVHAVEQIGIDRAVPRTILEVMKVEGLTREKVASHLQKYRIFLRKLSEGTLRKSPFADESEALRRNMTLPSFIGSPSSSSYCAKMNSSSAVGTQVLLPTESVQVIRSQKNLGIPQSNMEPVVHSVNLTKDVVHMPVLDTSKFISSSKSNTPVLSGGLPGASQCYPSGPSGSFLANSSNSVVLNASKPFSADIPGSSFANISNDSPPLTANMSFSLSRSYSSYASILRGKILGSSRGIPFEDISDDLMLAPSGHLLLQSPDLVNQPSVQLQSCFAGQFNKVPSEVHQIAGPSNSSKAAVPSRFSDLGHNVGTSEDPAQGIIFKINHLSRFAGSSGQVPTFGSEYQNETAGIMGNTIPMVGFKEQVGTFSFGNNTHSTVTPIGNSALASSSSTRPDLQIDNNSAMVPTQVLNGGGASDNLHVGSTFSQQPVSDHVNNINEFLMGTSEAHNAERDDFDDFLSYVHNKDWDLGV